MQQVHLPNFEVNAINFTKIIKSEFEAPWYSDYQY